MFKDFESTKLMTGVDWAWIEPIVARFEANCRVPPWPEIEDYLPQWPRGGPPRTCSSSSSTLSWSCAWRAGEPVCAREYLERYPELALDATAARELLAREAELSRRDHLSEPWRTLGRFESRARRPGDIRLGLQGR